MTYAFVIGYPIKHSLSPVLHGHWLEKYGIEAKYLPLEVEPEKLPKFVQELPVEVRGFNLTLPHKQLIQDHLAHIDPVAEQIGAVNTVVVKDGRLHGFNTDAFGFWQNLRQQQPDFDSKGKTAVMLGAGGAAYACGHALQQAGFGQIHVVNRTTAKAEKLAAHLKNATAHGWEDLPDLLPAADLLVNTTALGMKGQPELQIDLDGLPPAALVYDIVYNPLITPLLEAARDRGNPIVTGLGMLVEQARPAFHLWFGVMPQADAAAYEKLEAVLR